MSIHSSLRSGGKGKKHRSVLKRYERLRVLKDKALWSEESSVLGLPKVKMQKLKVKKEKAATTGDTVKGVAGAPAPEAAASATKASADKSAAKSDKK